MKKKLLCIALAFVFTVGLGLTAQAEDLALPAPSCILMEKDTGQILYEENAHEKLRPASVTKIICRTKASRPSVPINTSTSSLRISSGLLCA